MTRKDALKPVVDYLKAHNIAHAAGIDSGCFQITMSFPAADAPDNRIEACIWFYEDGMEARAYYPALGQEICRKSGYIAELYQLLNFINARVFMRCSDGGRMLYTPRIYLTADGCYDITITTMIPYDFFELAPLETCGYLTGYCPELLDRLTFPIFGVLLGKESPGEAAAYIKKELLDEREPLADAP